MSTTILCLDSATAICSVALWHNGQVISEHISERRRSHTEMITLLANRCVVDSGLHYRDLDAVAVIAGPGSYTSLRIGASTAKGLCYALSIPMIAIDTLEHIVQPVLAELRTEQKAIAMLDARRMEVYSAAFDKDGLRLADNAAVVVDADFTVRYGSGEYLLVGDGAAKTEDILASNPDVHFSDHLASASHMGKLAVRKYKSGEFVDVAYWEPNYTKPVNIIKSKKKLL